MKPYEFISDIDFHSEGHHHQMLTNDIEISSNNNDWVILSYYAVDGHMVLDIKKKKKDKTPKTINNNKTMEEMMIEKEITIDLYEGEQYPWVAYSHKEGGPTWNGTSPYDAVKHCYENVVTL